MYFTQKKLVVFNMFDYLKTHDGIIIITLQACQWRNIHADKFTRRIFLLKVINDRLNFINGRKMFCFFKQNSNPAAFTTTDLENVTVNIRLRDNIGLQ